MITETNFPQENLDDIITIEDDELVVAFLDMVENHKMIVENSGLLTVAALKHLDFKGKKVVSVLSGGNMDIITMSSVVQHGLIQRDRIFTVSVLLPDKPGELVNVASIIAEERGNVIKLDHNQFVSTNRNAAVELRITLESFGTEHKREILKALEYNLGRDMELGYTSVGPHRDDIVFKINGIDAVKFASQGQQRTLVLALRYPGLFHKKLLYPAVLRRLIVQ